MKQTARRHPFGLGMVMELFDIGPGAAITVILVVTAIVTSGVVFFFKSAPPTHIRISSGPEGSMFHRTANRYAKALKDSGVHVEVLTSKGSLENLARLADPNQKVDLALVQGGIVSEDTELKGVVSLGAIAQQPIFFFYRGPQLELLQQFRGKKIAVGQEGSGTRQIALKLLELNNITAENGRELLNIEADDAAVALMNGEIDAAFIMSENIAIADLRKLMRASNVRLMSFKNAAAYTRKMGYLNVLELPQGVIDFGLNIPANDVLLMGPMIELVASKKLHPALSDLILDAATTIHARPGLFQKRSEFPTPMEQSIPLSEDASRFYKSGKTLLYRHLPFWLASLLNRVLLVFLPMAVILIPALRSLPFLFRWRSQMRIRRLYRELLRVEERFKQESDPTRIESLQKNFERIDNAIKRMRVRPAYADQFYHLRVHVDYVRRFMSAP